MLNQYIQEIKQINLEPLNREDLGSELNFKEVNSSIKFIRDVLLGLENKKIHFTNNVEQTIKEEIRYFIDKIINPIYNFRHQKTDSLEIATQKRNDLIKETKNFENKFSSTVLPIILYNKNEQETQELDNDIKKIIEDTSTQLISYQKKAKEIEASIQNLEKVTAEEVNKAKEIRQKAEEFSMEKITSKYGIIFEKQAGKNFKAGIISLTVFIISGLFITLILYKFIHFFSNELSNIDNIKNNIDIIAIKTISKITFLYIFLLINSESLKNFNINMNLYTLNKHRHNSLLSFDTFISNTTEETTRNYLIKEIAKTIYSFNNTGYLKEKKLGIGIEDIIKIIKNNK